MEHINTEGVAQIGELNTRSLREAQVAEDYRNARVSAAVHAYENTALWVRARLAAAGPYDDTRPMLELLVWLGDKIRETQSPATTEV